MKMMYNGTEIKSLKVKHYEMDTNDCDMIASDMQAGKTAVARGKKITGTGKSFEFAWYGQVETNQQLYIPSNINVIEVSSTLYPVQLTIALSDMKNHDFSVAQTVCRAIVNEASSDIIVTATNNSLLLSCDKNIKLQVFYGKDNYT